MRRSFRVRLWSAVIVVPICIGLGACSERQTSEPKSPDPLKESVESTAKPLDYEALMQEATQLVDSGHPARSLSLYTSALALRPGDAEALFGRGLALVKLRDAQSAIHDLKKALVAEPTFADAVYVLAEAYRFSASLVLAQEEYERYLELDPQGPYADAVRERLAEYPAGAKGGNTTSESFKAR